MGDINTKGGTNNKRNEMIMDKHGITNKNDNGERLIKLTSK